MGFTLNYEHLWKELEALVIDMRSKGKEISPEVVEDLKSAKTLMTIQRVDPSSPITGDVEDYLGRVEAALLPYAENDFEKEYSEHWLQRIQEAKAKGLQETVRTQVGLVTGIPKDKQWIRVRVAELIDMAELKSMTDSLGLSFREEANDAVIVFGQPESVKAFLRELTARVKKK
jgi:hypothetical protein